MEKTYDTLTEKYSHLFIKDELSPFPMFGFECSIGWYDLLNELLENIDIYLKTESGKELVEGFFITQIKEKFGSLRFYYEGGDNYIYSLVSTAENLSDRTCEFCGSTEDIMTSKGWIITACKKCTETREKLITRVWIPKKF